MFGRTAAVVTALTLAATACASEAGVSESTSAPVDDTASDPGGDTSADDPDDTTSTDDNSDNDGDGNEGSSDDPDDGGPDDPPAFEPEALDWDAFDGDIDVALLEVPVDYADPDGDTFELFLARHRALDSDNRIGSLLVNPGGPGFGGSDFAFFAPQIFDRDLLDRFDIIGWDPRGTGESEPPVDCIDDYDPYFTAIDSTPETDEERAEMVQLAEDFAAECISRNADIIDHVGTNSSARDMDTIRRALGEDQISYFGFSYGSELGATWATLFPDTVRAAVLDGAADPNADALESSLQQMRGFQGTLETFLAQCNDAVDCEFRQGGDATEAFLALMAELDANPLLVDPDRPPVNRDVATLATVQAMYSESYWPVLRGALANAQRGDGAGLLDLNDAYYQRNPDGTYGNELEAFQVISCADTPDRPTPAETDAEVPLYVEAAPLLFPADSMGTAFCNFFPPAADPRVDITGAGAGPIVVIGTTGDPATPFESTVRMADTLDDGRLVIVEADQHTGYGLNRCVVDVVNDYLVDLEPPADGTECR
jgi:pimeloyl-ACP methyl ester carboxylesterase